MPELFELVPRENSNATAIVGMTKNVGKTVTFNCLVRQFERTGVKPGLVSAGYDGERFDRLTLKEKPRIYAPAGAFVATAKACFEASEAGLEFIDQGSVSTPLGPVFISRVEKSGFIELAGPGSVSGLKDLISRMYFLGAGHGLVDGAINRLASASPLLTGAVVPATGSALGPTMEDVIRKTVFRCKLLQTPAVSDPLLRSSAQQSLERGSASLISRRGNEYCIESIQALTPLLAVREIIGRCTHVTEALVFGGALVNGTLQEVTSLFPVPPKVIVMDATKLFITPEVYRRYMDMGGELLVVNQINLVAVTLNPADPGGHDYDPHLFLEQMTEALKPLPVFDLVYQKG